jgi:alkylated DNA repair dioxygenase AlkB
MIDSNAAMPPSDLVRQYRTSACNDVLYFPDFVDDACAMERQLTAAIAWREESLLMFGRRIRVPRLCAWYGDNGVAYRYSHTAHEAEPWPPVVRQVRDTLHRRLGIRFNFVLANLYRDGNDAIGWHADDERELGAFPCIASLSFGAPRRFCLRGRGPERRRVSILLEPGSLLVMWGTSQHDWQHSVPRSRSVVGPRVNLTFRTVENAS